MKPAPFDYVRPDTLDEACRLMACNDEARLLAGGQTLIPLLAMRFARPALLVDIARLEELQGIEDLGDQIVIGAGTRQSEVERSALIAARLPLLAEAIAWVGHAATRARGTVGGSLANADPAAEIPLVALTLGAGLDYRHGTEVGTIAAEDFFLAPMVTALPDGACLTAVRLAMWEEPHVGSAFDEISTRRSDFAIAAAAAQLALDADGRCRRLTLGVAGAGTAPLRLDEVGDALTGEPLNDGPIEDALADATRDLETVADGHASAAYRRRAARVLAVRVVMRARDNALAGLS